MKPPPRTRTKTSRCRTPEPEVPRACKRASKASNKNAVWSQTEKKRLSYALRRLNRTSKRDEELDYDDLAKSVPTRSPSEVQSVVESLKNKAINCGSLMIRKWKLEEENGRKPIQVWTDLASAVAGTREEVISSAFSQMMVIASTEPCTLKNCDPPYLHGSPPNKGSPARRVSIKRPMPHLPAQGISSASPLQSVKSEAGSSRSSVSTPNNTISSPQQHLPNMAGTSAGATSTSLSSVTVKPPHPASQAAVVTPRSDSGSASETQSTGTTDTHNIQQPSGTTPTTAPTTSTSKSTSSAPHATPSPSGTGPCPSASMPAVGESGFSQRGRDSMRDNHKWLGVKYVVDFEKIYRYLGSIHKPSEQCHLTPMESAIVLDLLMSLPEEILQLDCHRLNKHLTQVYKHLSSSTRSKDPKDRKNLNDQQNPDRKDSDVTDGGGEEINPSSSSDNNASSKSHDTDMICPPLNPFMIPLKLLKRKKVAGSPVK